MTFDPATWWLAVLLLGFVTGGLVYLLKRSVFGRIDKIPSLTDNEKTMVSAWIKEAREKDHKTFKAVLPNCAADHEGIHTVNAAL